MLTYPIVAWNPVILPSNTPNLNSFVTDANPPLPMVYVLPDEKFLQFVKDNDYKIVVKVDGSNSCYDTRGTVALVNTIENIDRKNARPLLYHKTKLWAIVLIAPWLEYPPNNGTITLYGEKGVYATHPPPMTYATPTPIEVMEEFNGGSSILPPMQEDINDQYAVINGCQLTRYQIFITIFILVLGLCVLSYNKKK